MDNSNLNHTFVIILYKTTIKMNSYKFVIIRKGKEIFNSIIEAPNYKTAYTEYLRTIKECEIEIMPFDYMTGKTINYKH